MKKVGFGSIFGLKIQIQNIVFGFFLGRIWLRWNPQPWHACIRLDVQDKSFSIIFKNWSKKLMLNSYDVNDLRFIISPIPTENHAQLGESKRESSLWKTPGPGLLTGRHNKYSHPGPRYQSLARALWLTNHSHWQDRCCCGARRLFLRLKLQVVELKKTYFLACHLIPLFNFFMWAYFQYQ